MLINNIRELAYIVKIDNIEPIDGSDNCEAAIVGGWKIMTRKNTFKVGDFAIYFEIDSKVPETKEFEFLKSKHYKIKTQKYSFGGKGSFISQGLLMPLSDFPDLFEYNTEWLYTHKVKVKVKVNTKSKDIIVKEHDPMTQLLGVIYSVAEDNKRKSKITKYDKMYQRHLKLFKKYKILRKIYKYNIGKKALFLFLGNKRDKFTWPDWVKKTDEDRVQNLPYLFPGDAREWIVTEKIDGSSTTFTYKRSGRHKGFYVCSRNVCFDKPEKEEKCYYNSNIYIEMANKYNIEEVLRDITDIEDLAFVTIQGETYGGNIQKRTYGLASDTHDFMAFNLIFGYKNGDVERKNSNYAKLYLSQFEIPFVPIIDISYKIPKTCDEILQYAGSEPSEIDGGLREGVVLRDQKGIESFKVVDNSYLLKYHQ